VKLLVAFKREFGGEDDKSAKVAKLKRVEQEQESQTMKKFVYAEKQAAGGSGDKDQVEKRSCWGATKTI